MKRLAKFHINAKVTVLKQAYAYANFYEKQRLRLPSRKFVFIREVKITSDNKIWMHARTVIPLPTLTGKQKQLTKLKNRPIGSKLFTDPLIKRRPFELRFNQKEKIWGRRSIFYIKNKPLLLTEFFMPVITELTSG